MIDQRLLNRSVFVFNPQDKDGNTISMMTEYFNNGVPGGVFTNQEITLYSNSNSASFHISGFTITPEMLRNLADQLEKQREEAISMTQLTLDKTH